MACLIAARCTLTISPPCWAIQVTMKVAGSEQPIGGDVRRSLVPRMYREDVGVRRGAQPDSRPPSRTPSP
jgi:hypothetical protein